MSNKTHLSQVDDLVVSVLDSNTDATVLLTSGETYYGTATYVSGYTHMTGFIYSDVDSAASGVIIEQALREADLPAGAAATTGITHSLFSLTGGDMESNSFSVQLVAPWVRVIYINGGSNQTEFKLYFETRILRGL